MDKINALLNNLTEKFPDTTILRDEPMKNHTSFRIGGRVSALIIPKTAEALSFVLNACREADIRCEIIGNGTNLLVSDELPEMVVIKTSGGMDEIRLVSDTEIYAGCGALLSKIASFAMKNSLTGFEFAHGIPGSLGGAVVMNAGAYGGEIKDVLKTAYTLTGEYDNAQCDFSYRHSRFSDGDEIVTGAVIALQKGNRAEIEARMTELSEKRHASQPLNMPSAGSTFKRPVGGYAAALIDNAGLKGYAVGGARVSEKHAGFVVNGGNATCADVLALTEDIKRIVYEKSGISLELEVKIVK